MHRIPAALQSPSSLRLIRQHAIDAHAHKSPQTRLCRIEAIEKSLLDRPRKKFLRQILRVLARLIPMDANVFVNRLPVGTNQQIKRPRAFGRIIAARGQHRGPARQRKAAAATASAKIAIVVRHAQQPSNYSSATTSISTSASFGSRATSTVVRPGGADGKYRA